MTPSATATTAAFAEWMALQQSAEPARRKGERTRDRIRLVTVALLNEVGYRDMKVADICARAEITPPVLYLYFETKQALTIDVLREFLDRFLSRAEATPGGSAYASMLDANMRWIALARANAGLLRCLLEVSAEEPAFARLFATASDLWYQRIARSIVRRFPSAAVDAAAIRLIAHAMGAMMDELTRKLFTGHKAQVQLLAASVAPDDTALAHFLTVIWYRALYGASPTVEEGAPPVAPRLVAAGRRYASRTRSR